MSGAEEIRKVLVFDERYVSQFAFQRDEVLKDSFEVFINTTEYQRGLAEIEAELKSLKTAFDEQEEFDAALSSFTELRDAFNVTKSGALSKASKGVKAIGMGKKLTNIPEPLGGYKASWIATIPPGG